jgi:hypothetical protein
LTWINGTRRQAGIFHLMKPDEDFDAPALMALEADRVADASLGDAPGTYVLQR